MAYFAQIDENSYVAKVIVVNNNELLDENGVEQPQKGIDFLINLLGGGHWVQTSFNSRIRKCFAGIGFFYDQEKDVFVPPQPLPSWVFDDVKWKWQAPVPYPTEGNYVWNEEIKNWIEAE